MERKAGQRVGAISHSDTKEGVLFLFGYGVYLGEFMPPKGTPGLWGMDASETGNPNPCIKLDNGALVWGCQCWWGPEDQVRATVDKFKDVRDQPLPDNPPCEEAEKAAAELVS